MRHWRKAPVIVHAAPPKDTSNALNALNPAWPELPMPRDSHLYSPMSQALLRAARMGRVNQPPPAPAEDEKEPGDEDDGDGEPDAGFVVRRWTLVPKHLEGPEPEFLAKRRKGLPSFYAGTMGSTGTSAQMRKTKIRKLDSEGNVSVWDVLVPEGQTVEGEILEEETAMTEAPAPGTVVEGVGVVNAEGVVIATDPVLPTPPRRRAPPPKRKGKGPAKGKRKRVGFVSISKGGPAPKPRNEHVAVGPTGSDLVKPLGVSDAAVGARSSNGIGGVDTPMQEGEEGPEEGSEDDDEGEEGEDNDREEGELSPSPTLSKCLPKPPAANNSAPNGDLNHDIPALNLSPHTTQPPPNRDISSSPDLPLAATQTFQHTQAPLIRIEPAPDTIAVPASETIQDITPPQHVSVSETYTRKIDSANAQPPLDHDPFDTLTAPAIPPLSSTRHPPPMEDESIARFTDGEEDLLGSLERSLGRRGEGEAAAG